MENLNSSSAFHGQDNHAGKSSGHFPTLPLSGFSFTPNCPTSPSGHLMVPGSAGAFSTQTVPRNHRVVPMITRSQSSSNLPENTAENLYDEVGGSLGSHMNYKMPKKSCSQWDMLRSSGKSNHLQVSRREMFSHTYQRPRHLLYCLKSRWLAVCQTDWFWKARGHRSRFPRALLPKPQWSWSISSPNL